MTYQKIIFTGALLGMLAIILGAFGAHALAEVLSDKQLQSFKTGNTYQMYQSLYLIGLGIIYKTHNKRLLRTSFWLCLIGVIFFSGSIYLLSCRDLFGISNLSFIGPITPIGGLLMILSWAITAYYFLKA